MASVSFGTFSKRKNSTKQPAPLSDQRTVTLKEDCSQDHPVFICSGNNFNYNYCMWDSKYYFIEEIVSLANNEIEIRCVMDPLATYKTEIVASTQFVSYSSQAGDAWLADDRIPLKASTAVSASSGLTGVLSNIGCYILTVTGVDSVTSYMYTSESVLAGLFSDLATWRDNLKQTTQQIAQNYAAAQSNGSTSGTGSQTQGSDDNSDCFNSLNDTLSNLGNGIAQTITNAANAITATIKSLADVINMTAKTISDASVQTGFVGNAYENAMQCVRSCIWVPFDSALSPGGSSSGPMQLGTYPIPSSNAGAPISAKPVTGSFTVSIPWQHSDWRRKTCEDVYLYLPLVGMVQLSGDSLISETSLTIDWSVTYTDGCICYKVKAGNQVIGAYSGNGAVNYPVGIAQQASAGAIAGTAVAGAQKVAASAVQGAAAGGGIGAVIGGLATAVGTGYQVANAYNSTHISTVGNVGGGAGLGLGRDAVCYTVNHDTIIAPVDMKDTMGLPTMKPIALSTLTGFCQCANAHVDAPATAGELDAIDFYLNSGFYIE